MMTHHVAARGSLLQRHSNRNHASEACARAPQQFSGGRSAPPDVTTKDSMRYRPPMAKVVRWPGRKMAAATGHCRVTRWEMAAAMRQHWTHSPPRCRDRLARRNCYLLQPP